MTPWDQIKPQHSDILILGNGASVSVHEGFKYQSLKEEAKKNGWLTDNVLKVFEHLKTDDFEMVLNILWQTFRINQLLEVPENLSTKTYQEIQEALIRSVQKIHVSRNSINDYLTPMWKFMFPFRTVISLNYDFLVYWAMLAGNDVLVNHFKDCFINQEFDYDKWQRLRESRKDRDHSTLVFYPHGNLCIATYGNNSDKKINSQGDFLLDKVLETWRNNDAVALFVSEGSSQQKKAAIRRSKYLNAIYNDILPKLEGNILIYGWSMSENDEHLLERLIKPDTRKIAISLHRGDKTDRDIEETCAQYERKVLKYSSVAEVSFFDSEDAGC